MRSEKKADYNQSYVLPPHIEDWVSEVHPARFIRLFVEGLDLSEYGFAKHKLIDGRSPYSTDLKLKIWLYGYFHNIRTLRALELACNNDIGMMWLTGLHHPDHSTLGKFWNKNKEAITELFKESTRLASKAGLLGLVLQALDGTKIKADVCDSKGIHEKDIEKILLELDKRVDEIVEEIEAGIKTIEIGYDLPPDFKERVQEELDKAHAELSSKNQLSKELSEAFEEYNAKTDKREELKESLEEFNKINRKHLHIVDKDARMMKSGKGIFFCFNGQAVVDGKSSLIIGQDVVNDEFDNNLLVPMIEKVEETLGDKSKETVADGGYYSPEQLLEAEEKGHEVLVNIKKSIAPKDHDKFHKSNFTYNEENDVFVCPLGKELTFEREKNNRQKKYKLRIYRCRCGKSCPERENCSDEKRGKSIEIGPHHQALLRQLKKQKIPEKKKELYKRKSIVEKVFGSIKEIMGFRRFTVRGLEKVKVQWSLICTTYNLKKLFKIWKEGKLVIEGNI